MQDLPVHIRLGAQEAGFTLSATDEGDKRLVLARHANGAVMRTWLFKRSGGQRLIQIDAPAGHQVPDAMRAALGQYGGKDPARVTVAVAGVNAQYKVWQRAMGLASDGAWGAYVVPTKAQRADLPDKMPRKYALQLWQALSELVGAAQLDCVSPEQLERCTDLVAVSSPTA